MKYDSVLDQQSISGKTVSLILCVWKPGFVKSGHICPLIQKRISTYINAKIITNYKIADTQILTNS